MRSSWSEPQSTPSLIFTGCIGLLQLCLQREESIWFQYWTSGGFMCRDFSCVAGIGCLLWRVCSLGKTLLAFTWIPFGCQYQICLLFQVSPDSWFGIPLLYDEKDIILGGMLVREGLVSLRRTRLLQLLQHYCSGHRLGLLCYWMVFLGNEQRSFCCFWDCFPVLHFMKTYKNF